MASTLSLESKNNKTLTAEVKSGTDDTFGNHPETFGENSGTFGFPRKVPQTESKNNKTLNLESKP